MFQKLRTVFAVSLTIVSFASTSWGQLSGGGTAGGSTGGTTGSADTGTILSLPTANLGRVNSWVSRSTGTAVAVTAYEDQFRVLSANIRQYTLTTAGYTSQSTKIKNGAVEYDLQVVPVRLEKVEDTLGRLRHYNMVYYPSGYDPMGAPLGAKVLVGWLKFYRGNNGRVSSDVIIRFHSNVVRTNPVSPCDEPPVDDMGEEEEVVQSVPHTPGASLPLVPSQKTAN